MYVRQFVNAKTCFYVKGAYLGNGKRQSETDESFGLQALQKRTVKQIFNKFIFKIFMHFLKIS